MTDITDFADRCRVEREEMALRAAVQSGVEDRAIDQLYDSGNLMDSVGPQIKEPPRPEPIDLRVSDRQIAEAEEDPERFGFMS